MNKKTTAIVSYITLVGWLIAYFAGDKEGAKFHLNQSLVLAIAEIVLYVLSAIVGHIPFVGWLLSIVVSLASLVLLVFWILGLVAACKDEEKPIPVLGSIKILK